MVRKALSELFREVFQGVALGADGTWFVQGKEAIFDAMQALSPEQASARRNGQPSSIGAHVYHLTYYLSLFNASVRGENPEADWAGSWTHQRFSAHDWEELATRTRTEFDAAYGWYQKDESFSDLDQATYAAANVAHAAYHLGAIRALMPFALASG